MGINRIRLEFKALGKAAVTTAKTVLIESDWNLKDSQTMTIGEDVQSINRIRLEFKGK